MTSEAEIEIDGHVLRLEFEFELGRPAPRTSDPDAAGFSDPGDPGMAAVTRGWLLRIVDDKTVRERALPKRVVEKLRDDSRLEEWLYDKALQSLPSA